jgi:hypothetical protein
MKMTSTQRTALWAGIAVLTVGIAALVWWLTRHRAERILTGTGGGGNIVTAAVQQVVDTTHHIMQGQYFTVSELTRSAKAQANHIDNTPSAEIRAKLEALIVNCLDPIRRIYGRPIIVSSGYRCKQLNELVGGVANSQHTKGEAADLVPASGGSLAGIVRAAVQFGNFDQLILEQAGGSKWVHVSWRSSGNRRRILAYKNGRYTDITNSWESYLNSWA